MRLDGVVGIAMATRSDLYLTLRLFLHNLAGASAL